MRAVALSLVLALPVANPARADDAAATRLAANDAASPYQAGLPMPVRPLPPPAAERASRWGLLVDAGVPEGAAVSAVYRPVSQVRVWAGPAWSYVAFGAQGGVTVVPWHLGVSPLLSVEAGRYFATDASFLVEDDGDGPADVAPLLQDVTYDYAAAHVGVELGTRNGFGLSLKVGLAYVSLRARGRVTATSDSGGSGTTTVTFADPRIRGTLPSVKLGMQLWF